MTQRKRGWIAALGIAAAVAGMAALSWLPLGAANRDAEVREIVLVVRNMAFQPVNEPGRLNPTITLQAGSRVRITVKNEEPGVTHNFAIPAWNVDSGTLAGPGEVHVEFQVPERQAAEAYQCTPHAKMMRGSIMVR